MKVLKAYFLCFLLAFGILPFEGLHMLFESHEHEAHVCDYDVCVRELSHQCDLSVIERPKNQKITPELNLSFHFYLDFTTPALVAVDVPKYPCVNFQRGPPSFS